MFFVPIPNVAAHTFRSIQCRKAAESIVQFQIGKERSLTVFIAGVNFYARTAREMFVPTTLHALDFYPVPDL